MVRAARVSRRKGDAMPSYTHINLKTDVEDVAPKFGFAPNLETRVARKPLGLEKSGMSYYRVAPGYRLPFGHRHGEQEEVYLLLSGSARMKLNDDIVELKPLDAARVPGEGLRAFEARAAGPPGAPLGAAN